ncbi:MAG: hypothetical protein AVDCRST_MAG68-2938 [uncultured Gemmatimonadetes bacterium]|uniref:RES domain-containing protein n=1 Tax=uncultured Gemmatimonadota bacterium TaxID=203437 RepID=A0A6J4LQ58_9BACT|nr:MAG: hypothetical protein AVDCRST_MAG68-2938 [uncultured Gemmatimonadota bacterium]
MAPIRLPRRIPVAVRPPRTMLWRVHRTRHGALWYGPHGDPPSNRFDAPASEYGVCYFGESLDVSFLETLVRGADVVAQAEVAARTASYVATTEEMRFLQFEGAGLVRLKIGGDVAHAADYAPCQRMACDLYEQHPDIDGIQFRSRWDTSSLCWAVFDRAKAKVGPARGKQSLGDYDVIGPTLERHDIAVV